jgi:hypothetical protein
MTQMIMIYAGKSVTIRPIRVILVSLFYRTQMTQMIMIFADFCCCISRLKKQTQSPRQMPSKRSTVKRSQTFFGTATEIVSVIRVRVTEWWCTAAFV